MFSVSNRVTDDVFKKDLEDATGFFVDETGDTLYTTTTSETTNGGFGDTLTLVLSERGLQYVPKNKSTLNVVAENLAVTLCTTLAQALMGTEVKKTIKGSETSLTLPPLPRPDMLRALKS